jgi:hypothetical protein
MQMSTLYWVAIWCIKHLNSHTIIAWVFFALSGMLQRQLSIQDEGSKYHRMAHHTLVVRLDI